jgi:hypothetical protein
MVGPCLRAAWTNAIAIASLVAVALATAVSIAVPRIGKHRSG